LKIRDDITAEGGAYVVAFKLSDLDEWKDNQDEWDSFYKQVIEDSFDAIDRLIKEEHSIDFDYINIDKTKDRNGDELIVLYVTAEELNVEMKKDGERKFRTQNY
jgi:hypothetical protein